MAYLRYQNLLTVGTTNAYYSYRKYGIVELLDNKLDGVRACVAE